MPRYKITYYREYEVENKDETDALGTADQKFTDDIREMLSSNGSGKIHYIFNFNIEKMKK